MHLNHSNFSSQKFNAVGNDLLSLPLTIKLLKYANSSAMSFCKGMSLIFLFLLCVRVVRLEEGIPGRLYHPLRFVFLPLLTGKLHYKTVGIFAKILLMPNTAVHPSTIWFTV